MRRRRRIQESSRRPSQPKQRPHFYKIIVKASLESGELIIPKGFTRQFAKKVADVAVLKVPSGRKWDVEVKKVDGSVRFQNGWRGFLKYHSISVGHFLLFRYDGNSTFSVFIFNQSACEIDYPSDSGDDVEESNLHTECLIPLKKEPEEEEPVEPLDVSIPSQLLPYSTEELLNEAQEIQTAKTRRIGRTFSRKQRRNRNCQQLREMGDDSRPNGGNRKGPTFDVENEIEVIEVPSDNPNNETSMSTSRETSSYKMVDDARYPNPDANNALALFPLPSSGDVCLQFNGSEPPTPDTHGVESNCSEQECRKEITDGNNTPTTEPNKSFKTWCNEAQELQTTKRRPRRRSWFARKKRRNRNYQELRELGDESRPNGGKGTGPTFDVENETEVPSDNPNNETNISISRETLSYKMDNGAQYPNPDVDNALALVPLPPGGDVCPPFKRSKPSAPTTHGVESNCLERECRKEISAGNSTPTTVPDAGKHSDPSPMKHENMNIPSSERDKKVMVARKRKVTKKQREMAIYAAQMFKTKILPL